MQKPAGLLSAIRNTSQVNGSDEPEGFSTGMPISRAGIDIALHDLSGKLQNKSLAQMWKKPKGKSITLSWTVNVTQIKDADALIEEGKNRGHYRFLWMREWFRQPI